MTRKFSAYYTYVNLHKELRDCTSLAQCADVAGRLLDAYIDNRMIWEELNWYKEHGTVLGKHPAFREFRRRRELNRLSILDLYKRKKRVENNIWRVKSEMAKGDKPHLDGERRERLEAYGRELADIDNLLGDG